MRALWVKDDSANPTHSFKDRVVSVALTAARQLGFTRVACASTGNLANSVAAHAARAGLDSIVLIPADLEPAKIVQSAVYGGTLVAVEGSYDDVNRLCSELAETDAFERTAFVNVNVRPYYAEGSKTLGYEVAEQLGWRLPPQVVVPMASGSLLTKIDKAFGELVGLGFVEPAATACSARSPPAARPSRPRSPSAGTWSSRSSRPGSPSRSTSATRRTARTRWTRCGGPAGRSRTSATTRSATASGCWPDHRHLRRDRRRGRGGDAAQAARRRGDRPGGRDRLYNTGDGLKTLDAVGGQSGPTVTVRPTLRAAREAGLLD
jgi:threonine synthase